jgi:hypothetical protein
MQEINLYSSEELLSKINQLPNSFIYRGQSDASWSLQTTLERGCGVNYSKEFAEKYEAYAIDQFSSRFHLYDKENIQPSSLLEWLAIMQHYGVPTRLLDFTTSPYAALYFALETYDIVRRPDIALYCIDYAELMKRTLEIIKLEDNEFNETRQSINGKQDEIFKKYVDRFNRNVLWVTEPQMLNARIDKQSGCFLVAGNKGRRVSEIMADTGYQEVTMTKYIFPGANVESVFALLRKMNISGKSIYGDLMGLSRSLALDLKIYGA